MPCSLPLKDQNNIDNFREIEIPVDISEYISQNSADSPSRILDYFLNLQPVFVVTGSCEFISNIFTKTPDIIIKVENISKVARFAKDASFPLPINSYQAGGFQTVSSCSGNGQFWTSSTCYPVIEPVARAMGFLVSWFDSWNWSDVLLVGGVELEHHLLSPQGEANFLSIS